MTRQFIPTPRMADGFGYSPDHGYFQIKDNKAYWEDGDITDFSDGGWVRFVRTSDAPEHYAEWTDEQRATVKSERAYARERERQKSETEALQRSHDVLPVKTDNHDYKQWEIQIVREKYSSAQKDNVPCEPFVRLTNDDDGYFYLQFSSRQRIQQFIKQLEHVADRVWPK